MDGKISTMVLQELKVINEMSFDSLRKTCRELRKIKEIDLSCNDLDENSLKEILMNIVIRKSNELCQEEVKLQRLETIKDALDTKIENINHKNNSLSTFLVVASSLLLAIHYNPL